MALHGAYYMRSAASAAAVSSSAAFEPKEETWERASSCCVMGKRNSMCMPFSPSPLDCESSFVRKERKDPDPRSTDGSLSSSRSACPSHCALLLYRRLLGHRSAADEQHVYVCLLTQVRVETESRDKQRKVRTGYQQQQGREQRSERPEAWE